MLQVSNIILSAHKRTRLWLLVDLGGLCTVVLLYNLTKDLRNDLVITTLFHNHSTY